MTKIINLIQSSNSNALDIIAKGIEKPIKNANKFFKIMSVLVDRQTQDTFNLVGARLGHSKWKKLSPNTLYVGGKKKNGFNHRRGTDNSKTRMYDANSNSNIFQASRDFRKSFKLINTTNKGLVYGTKFVGNGVTAKDIIKNKKTGTVRQVLFVQPNDTKQFHKSFKDYINAGIKF